MESTDRLKKSASPPQGSRWTLQATTMDGDFGFLIIMPEQMQTVNPILILILVPIVDSVLYPLINKCKLNFTPLKKMTVGMFLAALAFIAAALVQIQIEKTLPKFPSETEGQVKFINMVERRLDVTAGNNSFSLEPFAANKEYLTFDKAFVLDLGPNATYVGAIKAGNRTTVAIFEDGSVPRPQSFLDVGSKPEQGVNEIRFLNGYGAVLNITVAEQGFGLIDTNNMTEYLKVRQGNAEFRIKNLAGLECVYSQALGFGSSYTLVVPSNFTFGENCMQGIRPVMDISPNSISMAWLIPQYFLITVGEVVFSVTGLEFSYSQAPSNMKSVLQAGWLLTVAVGNIIVLIVAEAAKLPDQWAEYILFASLLVLVCIIFAIMSYFYTYIDPAKIEAQFAHEPEDKERRKSLEMARKESVEEHNENRKSSGSSSDSDAETKQTRI